ncbi:MAG: plastocyanin/azurin family copper-binding protein [Thermoanaerobacterales bacterium]|nr:hypothetical protein [Thermoanaerobacterales bacterium]
MHRPAARLLLALLLAAGLGAACGGDDGDTDLSTGGDDGSEAEVPDDVVVLEGDEVTVKALDNFFRPENIQVAPGTTVTWTNDGRNEHDVLPAEGDDWGVEVEDFAPGDAYSFTFESPGVYDYYCSIHGTKTAGMVGTVVVAE